MQHYRRAVPAILFLLFAAFSTVSKVVADDDSVLKNLHTVSTLASTVPANGDVNPYGVARVEKTIGRLTEGHILVSNFNNFGNAQGTGTSIVDIAPDGSVTLFAQISPSSVPGACPGGIGLTTALVVLRTGWVIVGSLPSTDGTAATAQAGCLIVLNSSGSPVETFFGSLINGPWDMTSFESSNRAWLFVTNVLNGTVAANGSVVDQGTVLRINLGVSESAMPWIESMTIIGSSFPERTDPAALVIGPTGVALSPTSCVDSEDDCRALWEREGEPNLYVADTLNNRITVIPRAITRDHSDGTGTTLSSGGSLNGPLGVTVTESGHILTVNSGDGYITEIAATGKQIAKALLDSSGSPAGAGALFGLIYETGRGVIFVDDATNTLNLFH